MSVADPSSYDASSYDADELGQYRSLSTLAVVALVLGICSLVAFTSPLLIVVPLSAGASGLLALQGIAASEGGLTGGRLARCGLALAVFFAVGSLTRTKVHEAILRGQADRVARLWLAKAADGRTEGMLEWMAQAAAEKLTPSVEPGQPMPNFGNILASALMRQDPYVLSLRKLRDQGEFHLKLQDAQVFAQSKNPIANFRYVVSRADADQETYVIRLKRHQMPAQKQVWLVESWTLD